MSAVEKLPWQELPLTAEECGQVWEISGEWFLQTIASQPGFPERLTYKPATWRAGEVLEWRNLNRAAGRVRRRRSGSR